MSEQLREPNTPFQEMIRRLATIAMSCTHHDAAEDEEGYIHEVQSMEKRFSPVVRGYMSRINRKRAAVPASPEIGEGE